MLTAPCGDSFYNGSELDYGVGTNYSATAAAAAATAATATAATATVATAAATAATATPACCTAMASLRVLAFDHEGRPVQFDTWLDDLQLYLLSDSKDSVSLFDLASGAAPAPPATADSATRSQWLTRDAAARLAIRNHLPLAECAHIGQHTTAQGLYDAVVARYSSRATAALGRLLLPYVFPELSAFTTIEDLVSHLRTSDARYHATVPAEFLDRNQPPMFITLYFIVTCLPDSLSAALALSWRSLLILWPRVSLPETSPTLRWTGKFGDASVFRFYHPTLRRVLPSQDVTFDESVPSNRLFPYRSAPLPPPPLFLAPGPPPVDPLPPQGPAPLGVS
ncbi:unnamed protein product [Closterium sp. NIES-53]